MHQPNNTLHFPPLRLPQWRKPSCQRRTEAIPGATQRRAKAPFCSLTGGTLQYGSWFGLSLGATPTATSTRPSEPGPSLSTETTADKSRKYGHWCRGAFKQRDRRRQHGQWSVCPFSAIPWHVQHGHRRKRPPATRPAAPTRPSVKGALQQYHRYQQHGQWRVSTFQQHHRR